ncbi:hypothetical protein HNQ36_003296 [Afipia massiliensis]|uniref:Uncharacterized protein n=1 Tax=Afipia massiliensis TaxID=211460 RepID=A0A840MZG5_9BRAD|nr:hypothetical protein [Afipia massiliensis]
MALYPFELRRWRVDTVWVFDALALLNTYARKAENARYAL